MFKDLQARFYRLRRAGSIALLFAYAICGGLIVRFLDAIASNWHRIVLRVRGVGIDRGTTGKTWSKAEMIDNVDDLESRSSQLGFDPRGNAIALITQLDRQGRTRLWTNYYSEGQGWGTAELVESDEAHEVLSPTISFNKQGDGFATWQQCSGHDSESRYHTWIRRYRAEVGWDKPECFDNKPDDAMQPPQIVSDERGNTIAVWCHNSSKNNSYTIWAQHHTASTGWGKSTAIANKTGQASRVKLLIYTNGNAHALWQHDKDEQKSGNTFDHPYTICSNHYTSATGWGTAELLAKDVNAERTLQIAFDRNGNVFAIWEQHIGEDSGANIWGNHYTAGKGWGKAVSLEPDADDEDSSEPQMAIDNQGNAWVVWSRHEFNNGSIWFNRFTRGEGWGTAEMISADAHAALCPKIALDAAGNALILWQRIEGGNGSSLWAKRYQVNTGWSNVTRIGEKQDYSHDQQLAVDASGNALVVWSNVGISARKVWAKYYTAGQGWGIPMCITSDTTGTVSLPQIALHSHDISHVVWQQYSHKGGSNKNWTSRFK